jgi:transcriptional regulator
MIEAVTDGCPASAGVSASASSSGITPQEPNSAGSGSTDQVHAQAQAQAKAQAQDHGASAGASTGSYLPGEVLIIFTSPVDHYITPHFYTAANAAANGAAKGADRDRDKARIAPTWNYAAVQVYGRMRVFHDKALEETGLFLEGQLSDLARLGEEGVMRFLDGDGHGHGDGPRPWTLDDAPAKYIAFLKKNIVGMQVEITRVEGRFKVSQERPVGDREGVVDGLGMLGGRGSSAARRMAEFVSEGRVV